MLIFTQYYSCELSFFSSGCGEGVKEENRDRKRVHIYPHSQLFSDFPFWAETSYVTILHFLLRLFSFSTDCVDLPSATKDIKYLRCKQVSVKYIQSNGPVVISSSFYFSLA